MRVLYPITVTPAVLVSSSIPVETTYPAFTAGTTYNAGDRVILDGQAVYECLLAGVVGALPLSDAEWTIVRPTNRWAMFDQLPSTSRQQSDTLTITLAVPAVGDVMLLGVVAASVTVTLPDVTRTVTLASGAEQSVYITGLGSAGGNLTITIQPVLAEISAGVSSLILRVAEILVGTVIDLGETQLGAGVGISDYSTRTIDEYGNAAFVRRGYSGFLQAQFILDRDDADLVLDTITALRAVPCVWIGSLHYQCAVIYGYYREASMEIAENHAECSMRIESLAVDTLTGTVSGGGGGGGGSGGGSYDGWWSNWAGWEQPVISPPPPPPPSSNVVLLVRGESSPIVDESIYAHTMSITPGWSITSNAPPLFGSTNAMMVEIGWTGDETAWATSPIIPIIPTSTDFCFEQFIFPVYESIYRQFDLFVTADSVDFSYANPWGGGSMLTVWRGSQTIAECPLIIPVGSWSHIAMCRSANMMSVYLNGYRVLHFPYSYVDNFNTISLVQCHGNPGATLAYSKLSRLTTNSPVYSGESFPPLTSGY